ncbi:MAG: sugar ABC transporter ATP-binding protein [Candidatus Hinthialibacter antarcticus]|nr:sugar ABC transporter ATP-binding protein [Candidatus Hinthialibacter antarcticus]
MPPLLQMRNIHKTFGATRALRGVDLEVEAGQVMILAGENGAGKSTLMKVLTGVHQPDQGEILFQGQPFRAHHPKEALMKGIAMIYQEFNLALNLPVHANIFLGHECKNAFGMDFARQRSETRALFQRFDIDIDPDIPVGRLGVSQRQMVEIARALSVKAPLIIMDEPTAALSKNETVKLFEMIRALQREGVGVIYISHYLEEFNEIGDVVSVMRDGEGVGLQPMSEASPEWIIQMMVGRKIEDLYPKHQRTPSGNLLSVSGLSSPNGTNNVSLDVRAGEIVGVAGLVGAGRTEMMRALFGLDQHQMDALTINGAAVLKANPRSLMKCGVGLLSEDRAGEGLAQDLSIGVNLALPAPQKISRNGIVSFSQLHEFSIALMKQMNVKAESPEQKINQLSGGNQQKVALARLLGADAQVLLLDEPTRGIDVGSKAEIYKVIDQLAVDGKGLVMVSSYLPELLGMCDSVYVMHCGALSKKYPINQINADKIMALATGLSDEAAAAACN